MPAATRVSQAVSQFLHPNSFALPIRQFIAAGLTQPDQALYPIKSQPIRYSRRTNLAASLQSVAAHFSPSHVKDLPERIATLPRNGRSSGSDQPRSSKAFALATLPSGFSATRSSSVTKPYSTWQLSMPSCRRRRSTTKLDYSTPRRAGDSSTGLCSPVLWA